MAAVRRCSSVRLRSPPSHERAARHDEDLANAEVEGDPATASELFGRFALMSEPADEHFDLIGLVLGCAVNGEPAGASKIVALRRGRRHRDDQLISAHVHTDRMNTRMAISAHGRQIADTRVQSFCDLF